MGSYQSQAQNEAYESADQTEVTANNREGIPQLAVQQRTSGDLYSNGPYYNQPGSPNVSLLETH